MRSEKKFFELTSASLHVLAMVLMLLDHLWASAFPNVRWLTAVGRLAFPIFAFMIVEGYFHTHNFKRYLLRMLGFALLSEIPFDLLYSGIPFYWVHQNVLWTFLIALCGIRLMERARQTRKLWVSIPACFGIALVCFLLGFLLAVDYYGFGVLTVFAFYFFRGRKWWCFAGQLLALYWINVELLGGLCYPVTIFGNTVEIVEQGLALLSLIPIWFYRGAKGYSSKPFQYFCYAFYPLHCLILGVYAML